MLRILPTLALLLGLALVEPTTPAAAEPSPPNSITPRCISLVGTSGSIPAHAAGAFQVVVRDLANNPAVGAHVVIDLSGCPDLHRCADQLEPAVDIDCANKRVGKFSGPTGTVTFTLLGGNNGAGHAVELLAAGKSHEDGILIGSPTASTFDLDGANGVGINDLSVWPADFGSPSDPPFGRSDYDCSGSDGINDFSVWLTALGSATQIESCGATCP